LLHFNHSTLPFHLLSLHCEDIPQTPNTLHLPIGVLQCSQGDGVAGLTVGVGWDIVQVMVDQSDQKYHSI